MPIYLRRTFSAIGAVSPVYLNFERLYRVAKNRGVTIDTRMNPDGHVELSARGDGARELAVWFADSFCFLPDGAIGSSPRFGNPGASLQMPPQGYEFQSETLRKNVATTKAAAVVAFLEGRGLALSDEHRQRILACMDLKLLDQWIRRAGTVGSVEDLFG